MKKWQLSATISEDFIKQNPDIHPVVLQLLYNRGINTKEQIEVFLNNRLDESKTLLVGNNKEYVFYDPFLFRDMEKAVDLIISHIKAGNKIVVYGDYDADGVTSSVALLEVLETLQAKVEKYLPDRVSEGYGLNKKAIDQIASDDCKLIITVDNGIRNKEEISYAQDKGIDIIVTDHHVLPENKKDLPDCLVINSSNVDDDYPWKYLAGVGVAFKLISALLYKSKLPEEQKQLLLERSLDLVAVGTIADMVNVLGENRLLINHGLKVLNRNKRLGLNALIKVANINPGKKIEAWNVGWQIGPRLNAASRLGRANSAFTLLSTKDEKEAERFAIELNQRNIERQEVTSAIMTQVEAQIDENNVPNLIIGLAEVDQKWNEGVIGLVAGRISEKYYRPTLIISRIKEEDGTISFKGSGRSVEELNLIESIVSCSEFLNKYGGHPMACGFSVSSEDSLNKFKEKMLEIADTKLGKLELIPKINIEAELSSGILGLELVEKVETLAPFGQNNPQPKFLIKDLKIEDIMLMGVDSQHIKLRVNGFWALAFGGAERYKDLKIDDRIDLVCYLDINDFNGNREAQLKIIDIKKYD